MPRTTGLGIKGSTTIGGVPVGQTKIAGGALRPSAQAAFYPSSRATNPKVGSVSAIPAAQPRSSGKPNAKIPPTRG